MELVILKDTLAVCRLAPNENIPPWAMRSSFFCITKTDEELSVVCPASAVEGDCDVETDWKAFKVKGMLDFGLTGILASIATPLADSNISLFAISTYNTDYVLVKEAKLQQAIDVLSQSGFTIL